MMKKLSLIFFLFIFISLPFARAQVGINAVPFLQIEPDSRAAGMGNTGVAVADNASAVFWNPAGLAFQKGTEVGITHSEWLPQFNADLFYDYLVGKYHVNEIGTFGAHITYLNLGEQLRTDETGLEQGRFNSYEFAGGVSYGRELSKKWAFGTGVRFIYSSLAQGTVGGRSINPGSSVGVDLAGFYKSDNFMFLNRQTHLNLGMNLSNIGPGVHYTDDGRKDPLPTILRIGWALTANLDKKGVNTLTIANDYSKVMARLDDKGEPKGAINSIFTSWGSYKHHNGQENVTLGLPQQLMIATGIEYWYNNLFSLRSGYYYEDPNNGARQFITFGAGIRYDFLGVDLSYIYTLKEDHPLANTLRIGLMVSL